MSEEKLYAVKNDEGKYFDIDLPPWWDDKTGIASKRIDLALGWAKKYGGHVVTLVEASKPVEVSENEAKMLATLMDGDLMPVCELSYFVRHAEQLPEKESIEREDRLMRAYVNGYTVEKEKKYNVKVPHTEDVWYFKASKAYLLTICPADDKKLRGKFTESEIEHYGLQDCEKEEVNDDEQ